ncbi:MAG: TM2 domain-containing protein [Deltaproteobacteria bacterium]|nr:TM2 domain-containing protein [Deltaproteobacteria bacterium]
MVAPAPKSLIVGYLLWFFFGLIGVHRFYTGRWVTGIVWLLTGGLLGLGWLFDAVWTFVMVRDPK